MFSGYTYKTKRGLLLFASFVSRGSGRTLNIKIYAKAHAD